MKKMNIPKEYNKKQIEAYKQGYYDAINIIIKNIDSNMTREEKEIYC